MNVFSDACTFANGQVGQNSLIAVVVDDGSVEGRLEFVRHLGDVGVNIAEYSGVIAALEWAHRNNERIRLFTDSATVAGQVDGSKAVLAAHLVPLCERTRQLLTATGSVLEWVPREENLAGHYWERWHKERRHVRKA